MMKSDDLRRRGAVILGGLWLAGLLLAAPCGARGADQDPENISGQKGESWYRSILSQLFHPAAFYSEPEIVTAEDANPIGNFDTVVPGIYRGRKLQGEDDYRYLSRDLHVATVVNLRYFPWDADDQTLCGKYRLKCVRFPLKLLISDDHFNWRMFQKAFRFVLAEHAAGREVYFHCLHGSDRTGTLAAALTIRTKACNQSYDPDALWSEIDGDLNRHGFHRMYTTLHQTIKGWVYDLGANPWICAPVAAATP